MTGESTRLGHGRSVFREQLAERNSDPEGRSWILIPYDQLTDQIGPLSRLEPPDAGIVLVESPWKAARRTYHKQKLALILANLRHFALEQAKRGVAVRHLVSRGPYHDALRPMADELGPITVMEPAERELRLDLRPLVSEGGLTIVPHEGWLSTGEQFEESQGGPPPWRMDAFYRRVRQDSGVLMDEGGKPVGGKYSFDAENREPWKGEPPAPTEPSFPLDPIKQEVLDLVTSAFADHPGDLQPEALTATRADAEALWAWAKRECLENFGPYEDAMSTRSEGLFHTRISFLLHVHRLLPRQVIEEVARSDAPLASREGFIRQVLGWREFMRHVHLRTDGFRDLSGSASEATEAATGPATPSALGADRPLPPAWWGAESGLACLDTVVGSVIRTGYSHHITRLMVLSNLATLLDVSPRELTDWFWAMYTDAFDWVVEPNVLGMGTFGAGELMTTKPYVSGAAYINRMSDYCGSCAFDPKKDCPITSLYWAFLARHEEQLKENPRMRLPLASLRKRGEAARERDLGVFEWVSRELSGGRVLDPAGP
ncbi:MAG: cryptochrome/photolyase family protein [marine benthic group bacterium]|nr:cryptochrome/photolyase family protein [Gemmatimonadota bacterium]